MLMSSPPMVTNSSARPPKGFKGVRGLSSVRVIDEPQFAKTHGNVRGSKRKGLLYQERIVDHLDQVKGEEWEAIPGLWFEFYESRGKRFAQADWVGFNPKEGLVCIAEVKLSRVPLAWWQLNRLYKPLVQKLFPEWNIALLEITATVYNVAIPEPTPVIRELGKVIPGKTSVLHVPYAER